jgi:glycolate oxidase FAD binding subunit
MPTPPPTGTPSATQSGWTDIAQAVGQENLRTASPADTVDGVVAAMVAEPADAGQVARALQAAAATRLGVIPRGGCTKLGWGNPPRRADLIISTVRMNGILEHAWADMTATVEAGCTVAQLQSALAQHGQRLAIDPLWPERATIGGILSTNDSGALRVRYGSLRDLIIGVTVALADGTLARSGGKVVKNVAGYDLPKLVTGSFGTLGIVTQAIFRLHPLPKNSRTITLTTSSAEALNQLLLAILDSQLAFSSLQMRVTQSAALLDVRFDGTPAGIDAQLTSIRKLATDAREEGDSHDVWQAAQALWQAKPTCLLAKLSVLPANLHSLAAVAQRACDASGWRCAMVAQGAGTGWLQLEGGSGNAADDGIAYVVQAIRDELHKIGGFLVVYGCPATLKSKLDVWGPLGDSQPVMRRVKAQFDPAGILNPGRFVGGI